MRFKNPGGDLIWLTPLLILAGSVLAWINVRDGATGLAIMYAAVAFFSLLVWFDAKWVAIPIHLYRQVHSRRSARIQAVYWSTRCCGSRVSAER